MGRASERPSPPERSALLLAGRFSVMFLALWTVRVAIFLALDARIDDPALSVASSLAWKTALWIALPWVVLARRRGLDRRGTLRLIGLDRWDVRTARWSVATVAAGSAWWIAAAAVQGRQPALEPLTLVSLWWGAAVCEEILCRGFLLGTLRGATGPALAIGLSTLVFVLAHVPGWVAISHLSPVEMTGRAVTVAIIGVIAALLRIRSGSLVPPILFHGIADMIAS